MATNSDVTAIVDNVLTQGAARADSEENAFNPEAIALAVRNRNAAVVH